jgi:hypothetical protein
MPDTVYSDLSGIFHVQQQYLADLKALTEMPGSTGAPALAYMQDLRTKLNAAYAGYQAASPVASSVLDRQSAMQSIINTEVNRLDNKKSSIDSALYGQKRMAQFSDSYSKKYMAQIKILFIVIIVLIIYLGLTMLNNFIPIPNLIFGFVMAVVGIFAVFVIALTMRDINSRYNMDFDKLNLRAPTSNEISGNIDGNISAGNGGLLCVGESCCPLGNPSGAVWDGKLQQCLSFNVKPTSGFTLMSQASSLDPMSNENGLVSPYEPSEINSYTKI